MKRPTLKKHLNEIEPYAKLWEEIEIKIEQTSLPKLQYLLKCCSTPTTTNCGWSIYRAAKAIQPLVISEIARRRYMKKKNITFQIAEK
jgi:hypothetical protein